MFGGPTPADDKLQKWSVQFRQAEPATRRGELVHRNLLQDANVGREDRQRFYDAVAAGDEPSTPDEAVTLYETFLGDRNGSGPACCHSDNRHNRMDATGLPAMARVVDGDAFLKYNFFATNKRKVPRRHRATRPVRTKIRLNELQKKGITTNQLRGAIGGSCPDRSPRASG